MAELIPLFVTADDVIERMQLNPQLEGITDVVESAIQAAELHIEAVLGAKLTAQTVDCRFFLDHDSFSGIQLGGMFRLEIPNGFIRNDSPVTITYDTKMLMPMETAIDPTLILLDKNNGYLLVDADNYCDKYVRVQCTTGFRVGDTLPDDLYESILAYTATIFDSTQNTNRDPQAEPQYRKAAEHASLLLKRYMRLKGFSFRPIYSLVNPA